MSQIQMAALDERTVTNYDPLFCKTCQKKGVARPAPARALYSDCEKHFKMRVKKLRLTGVYIL